MKFQVTWIPLTEENKPVTFDEIWVVTKDGKVSRDARTNDTYFGRERLKWRGKGFQDLAVYHKWLCNWVTHWAKYIEPEPPDAPPLDEVGRALEEAILFSVDWPESGQIRPRIKS